MQKSSSCFSIRSQPCTAGKSCRKNETSCISGQFINHRMFYHTEGLAHFSLKQWRKLMLTFCWSRKRIPDCLICFSCCIFIISSLITGFPPLHTFFQSAFGPLIQFNCGRQRQPQHLCDFSNSVPMTITQQNHFSIPCRQFQNTFCQIVIPFIMSICALNFLDQFDRRVFL